MILSFYFQLTGKFVRFSGGLSGTRLAGELRNGYCSSFYFVDFIGAGASRKYLDVGQLNGKEEKLIVNEFPSLVDTLSNVLSEVLRDVVKFA